MTYFRIYFILSSLAAVDVITQFDILASPNSRNMMTKVKCTGFLPLSVGSIKIVSI